MKKIFHAITVIGYCLLVIGFASCSPDEFSGADETKIPVVEGQDFTLLVDQDVNQITVSYPETQGVYPIWIFNGATYSTLNTAGWANAEAGTYTVEMKLGNRNGFSQNSIKKTFTFNETKVNYTNLLNRIKDKEWRIDNAEPAHLACGPYGGDGTGWWSAAPDEKKGTGMYDDRISFTSESTKGGSFSYSPGEDGLTYINKDVTKWGTNNPDADVDVAIGPQASSFEFKRGTWIDSEGNAIDVDYLVLAPNTLFPYISSDAQYENPTFRIETLTATKMVLVYEKPDQSISWRFILTSKEGEKTFEGFNANSDFNMWKGITPEMTFYYNPDPGWGNEQTELFASLFEMGNNDYNVTVPSQCYADWQAQVHFHTNLSVNSATHYDFSCILTADKDVTDAIVKLTQDGDDGNFFFEEKVQLKAGEEYVFWKSDMPGIDANPIKLVIDFGHAGDDTHVNIRNVVLKDHANDDGTVLPDPEPPTPGPDMDWDVNSPANLWAAVENGSAFLQYTTWFADNGWSPLATQPEISHNNGDWEFVIPEGTGGSQWQGQFAIETSLTASAAKKYNFYMVLEADQDANGVTIKLTETNYDENNKRDNNFFFADRHNVKGGEPYVYKAEGMTLPDGDAHALSLVFDFGGTPAGTNIKISKIYFEEAVVLDYDDPDNLWKSVDDGSKFDAFGYYFADNSWSNIPYTEAIHSGNSYNLTLPEGMGGSQWQGQFHIDTKLTASASKAYHFQVEIEADNDCPGVTIKLTDDGDNNFFCEGRHDITGGEKFVYTLKNATLKDGLDASAIRLFFDFGGSPGGTNVKISRIVFKEAN